MDPQGVFELMQREVVVVDFRLASEIAVVGTLMQRYAPRMDLADACLVRMSELERESFVLTLDRDFLVYRRHGRHVVPTVLPDDASARPSRRTAGRRGRRAGGSRTRRS